MVVRVRKLTPSNYRKFLKKGETHLECIRCKTPLTIGMFIASVGGGRRKHYCIKCALDLYYAPERFIRFYNIQLKRTIQQR